MLSVDCGAGAVEAWRLQPIPVKAPLRRLKQLNCRLSLTGLGAVGWSWLGANGLSPRGIVNEILRLSHEEYRFAIANAWISVQPCRLMRWAVQAVPLRGGRPGVVGFLRRFSVDYPGVRCRTSSPEALRFA